MNNLHDWNILRIMRFYSRIGKPFNPDVYVYFMTPHDGTPSSARRRPDIEKVQVIIRRYLKNGWCKRDGENFIITPKGTKTIMEFDRKRFADEREQRKENSLKGGFNRPNERDTEGKYIKGERKRNKHGAFTK